VCDSQCIISPAHFQNKSVCAHYELKNINLNLDLRAYIFFLLCMAQDSTFSIQYSFYHVLTRGASHYDITLNEADVSLFERYSKILAVWNRRMNLVSSRDMGRFVEYHILDSLKVSSCFDFSNVRTLLDFGTGAGLPGIPLALAYPHIQVTLVDSRLKRCSFLEELLKELPSLKAKVIRSRLENLPASLNKTFDVVITRATVSLNTFFRVASRFITKHGSLIAIKGENIKDELHYLKNTINLQTFNISSTVPNDVENVRRGSVVIITHV